MNLVIETTGLTRVFGQVRAVDGLDLHAGFRRASKGRFGAPHRNANCQVLETNG